MNIGLKVGQLRFFNSVYNCTATINAIFLSYFKHQFLKVLISCEDPYSISLNDRYPFFSRRFSNLSEDNMNEETLSPSAQKYGFLSAYNNAKLCNILFANELHARWYAKGVNVYAVHPGNLVFTDISRHSFFLKILFYLCRPFTKSLVRCCLKLIVHLELCSEKVCILQRESKELNSGEL